MSGLTIGLPGISAKRAGFSRPEWKTDFIEIDKIFLPQDWQSFQHLTISGLHDRLQAHSPLRLQPNQSRSLQSS